VFGSHFFLNAIIPFSQIQFPVWLNADILPGPGSGNALQVMSKTFIGKVNADVFLNLSRSLIPEADISPGWRTGHLEETDPKAAYTQGSELADKSVWLTYIKGKLDKC